MVWKIESITEATHWREHSAPSNEPPNFILAETDLTHSEKEAEARKQVRELIKYLDIGTDKKHWFLESLEAKH